jgi:hypothetical protein
VRRASEKETYGPHSTRCCGPIASWVLTKYYLTQGCKVPGLSSKDVILPAPSGFLDLYPTWSVVMDDLYKLEVISLVNKITQEILNHTSKRLW